ncbi:MAG: DUF1810 domain-containing protein [Gemmatimonadales bacterium]
MSADSHDLGRFIEAQEPVYDHVIAEIRDGRKRTHWMWFVFPQLAGLGNSSMAARYAIRDPGEPRDYLEHPILGSRLIECAEAALAVEGRSAMEIFGTPDDLKLRSCATLFAQVSAPDSVFHRILDKYYSGEPDRRTLQLLGQHSE